MADLRETAVAWAGNRGISRETLERFGVGSGTASMPPDGAKCEVIVFPYRRGAETVNFKARSLAGKAFKQKQGGELRFFNLDATLAGGAGIVHVCEGEMDALALAEAGIPVEQILAVPNGAPIRASDQPEEGDRYRYVDAALQEGLSRFKRFVLLTDNDAPGLALRHDLARLLGAARVQFVEWPENVKDVNDFLLRHGPESLRIYVEEGAKEWPVTGLYSLFDIPEPPPLEIWRPGFPEWESKLAFAPTTLSVVTGHPGHGKTTLTVQLWYQMARDYGLNVAVASFETRAKPYHRRNIRQAMYGRPERALTDEERDNADRWNQEHFLWLIHPNRRPTLRWVLETAEVAVVRHNARALIIDPWNKLEADRPAQQRETEWIGGCLDELMDFARDMNVHVQVIAHPAKSQDFRQRRWRPALEDISGSKHWDNKVDLGLSVHRPEVFKDGVRKTAADLYVLKSRYDELGYPCKLGLDYVLEEGRFRAVDYRLGPSG